MAKNDKTKSTIHEAARRSREELDNARKLEAQEAQALESKKAHAEALRTDPLNTTVQALMLADYELKLAELRLPKRRQAVTLAERALVNDDTRLAAIWAPILNETVGMEPTLTTITPDTPAADQTPLLYVVQHKPATSSGGIVTGDLEVIYFRTSLYAALNVDQLEAKATRRGFRFTVTPLGSSSHGALHHDRARISVQFSHAPIPLLAAAPSAATVESFARDVQHSLRNTVTYRGERCTVHLMGGPVEGQPSARLKAHRLLSQDTKPDGTHSVVVEVTTTVVPSEGLDGSPGPRMQIAIEQMASSMRSGVGVVETVESVTVLPPDNHYSHTWTVTARFTLVSRVENAA